MLGLTKKSNQSAHRVKAVTVKFLMYPLKGRNFHVHLSQS